QWEVRKLQAEVKELSRPLLNTASFWFSAVTAIGAVYGIGYQYYTSKLEGLQAKIELQQAQFDTARAVADTEKAKATKKDLDDQIAALHKSYDELEGAR